MPVHAAVTHGPDSTLWHGCVVGQQQVVAALSDFPAAGTAERACSWPGISSFKPSIIHAGLVVIAVSAGLSVSARHVQDVQQRGAAGSRSHLWARLLLEVCQASSSAVERSALPLLVG